MKRAVIAVVGLWGCQIAVAQACDPKEYAEYKDEARSHVGAFSLASDYCRAGIQYETARKSSDLAIRAGMMRDAELAQREMRSCMAEQSKISNALIAAKATKALRYANDGCTGKPPL